MWLGVVTLFPESFEPEALTGVFARAVKTGLVTIDCVNPRDFTTDKHRTVDAKPYGGGPGMVMLAQPLQLALDALQQRAPQNVPVIFLSPAGTTFTQQTVPEYSATPGLILICGRYEGVDQRFVDQCVDHVWSIGDFVLSGGELAAMVVMDAISRHIPGVLGNIQSNLDESHLDGTLEYPQYTRPEICLNERVPEVLMQGDHAGIKSYRRREALTATYRQRPDLLTQNLFNESDRRLLESYFAQE